ncbi:MAG: hypothetical protein NC432_12165 [Roseburia sp.]|nr:hypothetical protein [Roseburia sp.]MCM1097253.1 hypothetical protein [Ruminococcus flavefaciens]
MMYSADGKKLYLQEYGENEILKTVTMYDSDEKKSYLYECDENGQPFRVTSYDTEGNVKEVTEIEN